MDAEKPTPIRATHAGPGGRKIEIIFNDMKSAIDFYRSVGRGEVPHPLAKDKGREEKPLS